MVSGALTCKATVCGPYSAEPSGHQFVSSSTGYSELSGYFRPLSFNRDHIGGTETGVGNSLHINLPPTTESWDVMNWSSPITGSGSQADHLQPDSFSQPVENDGVGTLILIALLVGGTREFFASAMYQKFCEHVLDPLNWC